MRPAELPGHLWDWGLPMLAFAEGYGRRQPSKLCSSIYSWDGEGRETEGNHIHLDPLSARVPLSHNNLRVHLGDYSENEN